MKLICVFLMLFLLSCKHESHIRILNDCATSKSSIQEVHYIDNNKYKSVHIDTLEVNRFVNNDNICDYLLESQITQIIHYIPWATDSNYLNSEVFIINGKGLQIFQSTKDQECNIKNNIRAYFYDNEPINTTRILIDSLEFDFDNVSMSYSQDNVFYNNYGQVVLKGQPDGWCGLSNRYEFYQFFDLKRKHCFELFLNKFTCD